MKIFYNNKMSQATDSESNSSKKPKLFIDLIKPNSKVEIISSGSVTKNDLKLAHHPEYVENIFLLREPNGFMNYDKNIPNSILYTIGSLYEASVDAIKNKTINCSPTSGFHHACYSQAQGYCTFNGLVTVAQMLKRGGLVKKVGILDLDFHYGNGTDDIIQKLNLDYITNISLGSTFGSKANSLEYLNAVGESIKMLNDCDIVLYQAGADLSIHDPLGGILSDEEMAERDHMVFKGIKKPLVWNLAGGYQKDYQKTLELHISTLNECLTALKERS